MLNTLKERQNVIRQSGGLYESSNQCKEAGLSLMQEVEVSLTGVIGYCFLYYTVIPLTLFITLEWSF